MRAFLLILMTLCLPCALLQAQQPSRIVVRGVAADSTQGPLPFATVMLLNPTDSALINFTRTDDKGAFFFKNLKNDDYLLKVSYVAYIPYQMRIRPSMRETEDLGVLYLKPISKELMEVVVQTAKAPLRIKGDTIEYDATTFKVPPGSTVEDLLRRLPGIEVDADGNLKAQGRDIRRVYVDGKTFFGGDPKSATKNLGAETISKVQIYNDKTEQSRLTGVDDGKKEKVMNLELKEAFKKGAFGKATAAVGTNDRWAGRANYNRFDQTRQLSFIGYGNNINETGVNWDDYSEFKGQNAWSNMDNGDFGFDTGSGRSMIMFGADEGTPLNFFDGRGFTRNFGGGTNYNFDNQKNKFNANYFYNQTELTLDQYGFRQNFLPGGGAFAATDTLGRREFRSNHSLSSRIEHEADSFNVIIGRINARISGRDQSDRQSQFFTNENGLPANALTLDNGNELQSWSLNALSIYRHKFRKKGRSAAVSAAFISSRRQDAERIATLNEFFLAPTPTEQIRLRNRSDDDNYQIKSSLLYTEPLSAKWTCEFFYNFSNGQNLSNRQARRPESPDERLDSLSVFFDFRQTYNRLGGTLRYSIEGVNWAAGIAAQNINMNGRYAPDRGLPILAPPLNRNFANLTPYLALAYEFDNNININLDYAYKVQAPSFRDLQPAPNVSNPAFQVIGNPMLRPQRSHALELSLNYWNASNFANFNIGGEFNQYETRIAYNQTIEFVDGIGLRTLSRPDNVSGGWDVGSYAWVNLPIIKTKLNLSMNANFIAGLTPTLVNDVLNETQNNSGRIGANLNLNLGKMLILNAGANYNRNNISYSIQQEQNQRIRSGGVTAGVKWQFLGKSFLESNFNYTSFRNDRFSFRQDVPILNASVRQLLGASNKVEIRLAAFDLLNRRISVSQRGAQNFISQTVAETLARYYMLSLSYNLRGYEAKLAKRTHW